MRRPVCAIAKPPALTDPENVPLLNVAVELASCEGVQCCVEPLAAEWLKEPYKRMSGVHGGSSHLEADSAASAILQL